MKICIATDGYEPQINGLTIAIKRIAGAIRKRKKELILIVPSHPELKNKEKFKLYKVFSIPYPGLPDYRIPFPSVFKIMKILKKDKITILHTHTPFGVGIAGLIAAKLLNIPVVHTYHTFFEEYLHYIHFPSFPGKSLVRWISRIYCNLCNVIIAPSNFMKQKLIEYGVKREIYVIPTGLKPEKFKKGKNLRKKFKIPSNCFVILYAGRLGKEKNIEFILQAFSILQKKYSNIKLMITGNGPEYNQLYKKSVELNIVNNVIFTGFIQYEKMKDIYATADLFVTASKTETQCLSVIEAASAGLPVVAIAERGLADILPHRKIPGITPVKDDMDEFIKAIEYYIKKHNKNYFQPFIKKFVSKFLIDVTVDKYLRIYENLT